MKLGAHLAMTAMLLGMVLELCGVQQYTKYRVTKKMSQCLTQTVGNFFGSYFLPRTVLKNAGSDKFKTVLTFKN